jgi:NitT/TauT family transport system substrate-binding protein
LEKGERPDVVHFAQINETDGFFLAGRAPDADFAWARLRGAKVLVDHLDQPLAMFKYACHRRGVDFAAIEAIDAGEPEAMDEAFREGTGDYIHQQGPAPQQLEHDGVGHVVASVGAAIGPCAFSSLAAMRPWLETDTASAFMRAYGRARAHVIATPAAALAGMLITYLPGFDEPVLAATLETYQALGCWTPHTEITRQAFDASVDVFRHAGQIAGHLPYDDAVAPPPGG